MRDACRDNILVSTHPPVAEVVLVLHVAIVGEQEVDPYNNQRILKRDGEQQNKVRLHLRPPLQVIEQSMGDFPKEVDKE